MDAIYQTANGGTIVVKWRGEKILYSSTVDFDIREIMSTPAHFRPLVSTDPFFAAYAMQSMQGEQHRKRSDHDSHAVWIGRRRVGGGS